jgi:hypothetical protein
MLDRGCYRNISANSLKVARPDLLSIATEFARGMRLKRLLKTGDPKTDESFLGVILRWTELNVYETLSWILQAGGLDRGQLHSGYSFVFDRDFDVERLAQLGRVIPEKLTALLYRHADGTSPATFRSLFFGHPVPKYVLNLCRPKICPSCLSESAHCRRAWDMALVTACPAHKCMLLDECPGCGRRVRWGRKYVCVCPCGLDWRSLVAPPVEDSELGVARLVYRICNFPIVDNTVKEYDRSPLFDLELEPLISALFFVASQYKGRMDTKGKFMVPSHSNYALHALITKAFLVFASWPDNFFSFLDWRKDQDKGMKYYGGLRKDFNEYKSALYAQLHFSSLDFMRDAFADYLSTKWHGGYISAIKRHGGRGKPRRYVSRLGAAAQLKVTHKTVDSLINTGKLTGVVHKEGRRRRFLISVDSINTYTRELDDHISLKDAARLLNLSHMRIMNLVEHGCLRLLRGKDVDGTKVRKFSRTDVEQLLQRIESMIQKSHRCNVSDELSLDELSFNQALKLFCRFNGAKVGQFIRTILDGEVYPSGTGEGIGLAALRFSQRDLLDYSWRSCRGPHEEFLCIPEAAKILGLERNFSYWLARESILQAREIKVGGRQILVIDRQTVESFNSAYKLLTAKDFKELKTSTRYMVELLADRGIRSVTGGAVGRGDHYLYRRKELEKANLPMLLTEARAKLRPKRNRADLVA